MKTEPVRRRDTYRIEPVVQFTKLFTGKAHAEVFHCLASLLNVTDGNFGARIAEALALIPESLGFLRLLLLRSKRLMSVR